MTIRLLSTNIAKLLLFIIVFFIGLLAAVFVYESSTNDTPEGRSPLKEGNALDEKSFKDGVPENSLEKRGGPDMDALSGIIPGAISDLVPGAASSLEAKITSDINRMAHTISLPTFDSLRGMPFVSPEHSRGSIPTAQPEPTSSEIAVLEDKLGGMLNGTIPLESSSIIHEATSEAQAVVASVEKLATDIASIASQVGASQLQAPDALESVEVLFENLDSMIASIVQDVVADAASEAEAPLLTGLSTALASDLGNIVDVGNGPVSLVGDLIEDNICGIVTVVNGITSTVVGICGDMASALANDAHTSRVMSASKTEALLTTDASVLETTAKASLTLISSVGSKSGASQTTTSLKLTSQAMSSPVPTISSGIDSPDIQLNTQTSTIVISAPSQSIPHNSAAHTLAESDKQTVITSAKADLASLIMIDTPHSVISPRPSLTGFVQPGGLQLGAGSTIVVMASGVDGLVALAETTTVADDCLTQTILLAGQTSTLTIYAYEPCPTRPPCPECPSPTCHCPNAGGPSPTPPPGGTGDRGPCPGSGYTCHDCLDGWFCPPPQTPAQPAPCGFGWPCVHCDGGWFCVPYPTPGPETCAGSRVPDSNSPGIISSTITPSPTSSRPSSMQSTIPVPALPSPKRPEKASSWGYCGCWADQPDERALNMEPHPDLGPLTNENCVQHCIIRGFLMASTEDGSNCYCGNFLNGTQKLDDSACSIPCTGDARQACGGNNALSCYSSDDEAHGWASAGPQPLPATAEPPEVISMDVGGVAHSIMTQPVAVFPPPGADMGQLISQYGKKTRQSEGHIPNSISASLAPGNTNGESGPGSPTTSPNESGGTIPPQSGSPAPTTPGCSGEGLTSPGGNGGNNGSPPTNGVGTASPARSNGPSSNSNGGAGASPTVPGGNGNTNSPSSGSGGTYTGTSPNSASNGNGGGAGSGQGPGSGSNGGTNTGPCPTAGSNTGSGSGSGGGGAGQVTSGGTPNSPNYSPASSGIGASPSASALNSGAGTPESCRPGADPGCTLTGNGSGQTQPSLGQGQGTANPNPTINPSGTTSQASTGQGQGSMVPNPSANPSSNGGFPATCTPGSSDQSCYPSTGGNSGPNPSAQTQGQNSAGGSNSAGSNPSTATHDPNSSSPQNGGGMGAGQTQGQTTPSNGGTGGPNTATNAPVATNPSGNGGTSGQNGQSQGQGTQTNAGGGNGNGNSPTPSPNLTANPSTNGGAGPSNGGSNSPNIPGQGAQSNPAESNGNGRPSTPGSGPTVPNGGNTPTGEGQLTVSNPNTGGATPSAANTNPQTSDYTFAPGVVPYGGRVSPSMTTLASMMVWAGPDEEEEAPVMLHHSMSSQIEPSGTPQLDFEEPPTTTTSTSMLEGPRWQRMRPVMVW